MRLAIFDFGGTLTRGETWRGIMQYEKQTKTNMIPLYLYFGTHLPYYFLYKAGVLPKEKAETAWGRDLAWTLWRLPEAEVAKMATWLVETYLQPRLRPEVVARLREHQAAGDYTLLLSGVVKPVAARMAALLGFSGYAATEVVVRHGRYAGRYRPPLVMGRGKPARLHSYMAEQGWPETLLATATAYADSYSDRHLLAEVGHPVAVDPDDALLALAQQKGWEIIGR